MSGGYPIVIYAPEPIGYSSPATDHPLLDPPYTMFTYAWSDTITMGGSTVMHKRVSSSAVVTIQVIHVDDAPVSTVPTPVRLFNDTNCPSISSSSTSSSSSSTSSSSGSCGLLIPFSSTDIDPTFSNQTYYYRITSFPLLGDLFQVGATIDQSSTLSIIPTITSADYTLIPTSSETTFSWAKSLMRVSSQFSNCGYSCFHPETCPSSCTDTEYRATNVLGAYDWYISTCHCSCLFVLTCLA